MRSLTRSERRTLAWVAFKQLWRRRFLRWRHAVRFWRCNLRGHQWVHPPGEDGPNPYKRSCKRCPEEQMLMWRRHARIDEPAVHWSTTSLRPDSFV